MKIFHPYGSKERLFEMMGRVNKLNEEKLSTEKRQEVVENFIDFLNTKLNLNGDFPIVNLSYDENDAQSMKSYGQFQPKTKELKVVAVNRSLGDILRTIAHEFVHHKQNKNGELNSNSGETGSDEENEANALAGVLMREFGKNNPIIFE
jgi:hypothetical protein